MTTESKETVDENTKRGASKREFIKTLAGLGLGAAMAQTLYSSLNPKQRAQLVAWAQSFGKPMTYAELGRLIDAAAWDDVVRAVRYQPASYIVYQAPDGSYQAKNGNTGQIEFSDTDAASVIQQAIDALPVTGGKIFIKAGAYLVEGLDTKGKDYIVIEGEGYASALFLKVGATLPLLKFSPTSNFVKLLNLRLSGNKQPQRVIDSFGAHSYLEIGGCYFTDQGAASGIALGRGAYLFFHNNVILCNQVEKNTDAAAIYTDYQVITRNIFIQTAGTGDFLTSGQVKHSIIANNVFLNTTNSILNGIFQEVNLGNQNDVVITDNVLDKLNIVIRSLSGKTYTGKRFIIKGNSLQNGGNIDLRILNAAAGDVGLIEDIIVEANHLDTGSVLIQGMKDVRVQNNFIGGGVALTAPNSNIRFRNNEGYVTENSGVATLAAGSTSVVVNHGLATAPNKVIVTPQANVGAFWVSNITATSFTINVATAPAANVNFYWEAEV